MAFRTDIFYYLSNEARFLYLAYVSSAGDCDWLEYCQNAKRKLWYPLVLDFWQRNNVFIAYSRMGYWRAAIA